MNSCLSMVRSLLVIACAFFCTGTALAQSYPAKPVRWIVASTPGGAFDLITRHLATPVSAALGQSVVVENRPGASGIAGVESVARSAPDGYTFLTAGNTQLVHVRFTHANLPYDPQREFSPVTLLGDLLSALFVHSSLPVASVKELIAHAKANPGKLNYGSAGIGHSFHLATELMKQRTRTDMVHVPYKGTGPALQDLFVGRIQLMFYPPTTQLLAQVKEGRLRAIGTEYRIPSLPDVPTFQEGGLADFEVPGWVGLVLPAKTPRDIVMRVNSEVVRIMRTPDLVKASAGLSMNVLPGTPEQFVKKIADDTALWGPIIKAAGIKPK